MSIAGSAITTLQKELRSPSAPRKIIKPVKSPSPSRRAAAAERGTPAPLPPFKEVRYQSQFELLPGGAYAVSEEEFEDWEPQVGPHPRSSFHFLHFNLHIDCHLRSPLFTSSQSHPALPLPHEDFSSSSSCLYLLTFIHLSPLQGLVCYPPRHPHRNR